MDGEHQDANGSHATLAVHNAQHHKQRGGAAHRQDGVERRPSTVSRSYWDAGYAGYDSAWDSAPFGEFSDDEVRPPLVNVKNPSMRSYL